MRLVLVAPVESTWRTRHSASRKASVLALALASLLFPFLTRAQAPAQLQTPAKVLDGTAVLLDHYDPTAKLRLAFVLTPPHLAEERQFLEDVQNKQSPQYHQYLTAEEWRDRFAPSEDDEQAVVDWAQSQGLNVTQRYPNRLLVDVEAPASAIEKAFSVTINHYRLDNQIYFSNDHDPVLPSNLTSIVHSVAGLNSIEHARRASGTGPDIPGADYVAGPVIQNGESDQKDASIQAATALGDLSHPAQSVPGENSNIGAPNSGYFSPSDMFSSNAYDYGALMRQGHCCNPLNHAGSSPPDSSIAIAAYGDVSLKDVSTFQGYFSYLAYNVQKLSVDGGYTCSGSSDANCGEVTLDTEWSLATSNSEGAAADTAEIFVYEGPNSNANTVLDVTNAMLKDGHARVMSTSWGCRELDCWTTATLAAQDYVYSEMVGSGWTLVAASGDQGAAAGCGDLTAVQFPASDPNVVGVGGTKLNYGSSSTYEVAWSGSTSAGSCSKNGGGSTGGFSAYFGTPTYQSAGFKFAHRAVPDIALDAFYGHDVVFNGAWAHPGGTSVAAPMIAGFFAQENAYLLWLGNKCGSGSSACAPLGNANYPLYYEGIYNRAGSFPFYDILTGCNNNDITVKYGLKYYCAGTGYDEVTGWGSANMLELAWALNWQVTTATGYPTIKFSGPDTSKWYNTNQTVNWTVVDNSGGASIPGTGIAGETQGWDSIPAYPSKEPHGGSGNSFYSGPQFVNDSTGCLAFEPNGCSGGVSQGCHVVHVEGWNNGGLSSGDSTYGPLCYDNIAPNVSLSQTPSANTNGWNKTSVTLTINASDPGSSSGTGSGISAIYYTLGVSTCSPTSLSTCTKYTKPFVISTQGRNGGGFFAIDKAGNVSSFLAMDVQIDETAPVTKAGLTGTLSGGDFTSAVTVTLSATDNLSGVASTTYSLDGGANTIYGTPFTITTPGSHTLKFFSTDLAGNVEATQTITILIASHTTTTLTVSPSPANVGQSVTLKATVVASLPGTPTGTVTFKDGSTTIGTGTLSSGVASLTTTALPFGADSLTAAYTGATYFLASSSAAVTDDVRQTTTTKVTSSLNPSTYTKSVTFTAVVTPSTSGTPTGSVEFLDGGSLLASVSLSGGKATYTSALLDAGAHSISAVYSGSTLYVGSTSATLAETIDKAATTTTLATSLNPSAFGEAITFAAVVKTTATGTPTGTVTFMQGSTSLAAVTLASGEAEFKTSALAVGKDVITAVYSGSANLATSTSTALDQVITAAKTTTGLTSSANPSTAGDSVTFTAKVTAETGPVATGAVTFKDGSTAIGTGTLNSSGVATLSTSSLTSGTHSMTAIYEGSTDDLTSTSAALSQVVH
jgi:hypothetical protein